MTPAHKYDDGIFYGNAFSRGSGVEIAVRRNQGDGARTLRLIDAVNFDCHGELHGVIGTQFVGLASFVASASKSG